MAIIPADMETDLKCRRVARVIARKKLVPRAINAMFGVANTREVS